MGGMAHRCQRRQRRQRPSSRDVHQEPGAKWDRDQSRYTVANTPVSNAGNICEFQPFAAAMALAVVGPPTFALLASRRDGRGSLQRRPTPSCTARWTASCTTQNLNRPGADASTVLMRPCPPVAAKNSCMNNTPIEVPALARRPICLGNKV
eukprot:CAMPEP_0119476272 /NCGR_PEP_ID=MMETSP1344-20130328/6849_1 /TAXON_ID=236787 /ORGANISM="Florenciella parvula, Strain CCMP2471" /LENGTH=150 /DNA_ID=CAMNT_0007509991 /DNA_START=572 /DNA_END=1021 /DNA_ORIENTATION=-